MMEDDDELMDELNELEAEEVEANMIGISTGPEIQAPVVA
jgi:hypothetical protein